MAKIDVLAEDVSLSEPTLVEGLPGVGLVGKIAADHLIESLDLFHYANLYCDGLPRAVTYRPESHEVSTPVRLYVDSDGSLLVLQSDVPVSPGAAIEVANCLQPWFDEKAVDAIYLSGLPAEKDDSPPSMYGVGVGDSAEKLAAIGVDTPAEMGLISGPTGALFAHSLEHDQAAIGLVVESDPQFPDPEAARVILTRAIEPLLDVEIETETLVDRAEEIRRAREQLAARMQQAEEESTRARPLGYQ